jgi:crotonobetainyl-CoA:carnitine CoA-transferase CaiB-like acyl-CoA transferase
MTQFLEGIRVVELASWTFVPSAGVVLAEWGAEVIKIEHPDGGDPARGLAIGGLIDPDPSQHVNLIMAMGNRGKRSMGLDLATEEGHEVLMKLVESADVFLTNWLPQLRERMHVDVEDIRARNPQIIYARGSGLGPQGPEKNKGGFDSVSYTARGGVAYAMAYDKGERPIPQPAAFGDVQGGMYLAGGVAAALLRRERTGETSVVDVSLLGTAMWAMAADIMASDLFGVDRVPVTPPSEPRNALVNLYRTRDDRYVQLVFLQPERYWPEFCAKMGLEELIDDPRFTDTAAQGQHSAELTTILIDAFGALDLATVRERLADIRGVWGVVQSPLEILSDPQAVANGYLAEAHSPTDRMYHVVPSPVQFDEEQIAIAQTPEFGEHTEEILLELGFDWPAIIELKTKGAVL